MPDWQEIIAPILHKIEGYFDRFNYRRVGRSPGKAALMILPYRGFVTTGKLFLKGRVLEDKGITLAADELAMDTLVNTGALSDEVLLPASWPDFRGRKEVVADEEGFSRLMDLPGQLLLIRLAALPWNCWATLGWQPSVFAEGGVGDQPQAQFGDQRIGMLRSPRHQPAAWRHLFE
jgi:hypothetical protein